MTRARKRILTVLVAVLAVVLAVSRLAAADSFTPVTLTTSVPATAHVGSPLRIRVRVDADPGVLDIRTSPLAVEVKLAAECGGTFQYTPGVTLLDTLLKPQPSAGRAYTATVTGSATPRTTGSETVCEWLVESGDQRVFASDQSISVDVGRALRHRRRRTRTRTHPHARTNAHTRTHARRLAAHTAAAQAPPIRHVFLIALENESASVTFGANSPAPYLATTLPAQGAFLPNYYATGHNSNDNYISMISGQAPNVENEDDCPLFADFPTTAIGSYGQQEGDGCVYPADIGNIGTQLDAAGDSWGEFAQGMGNDPSREAAECGHPGIGALDNTQTETSDDAYATRHNPFVYFHSIIDDTTLCDTHVVNLDQLSTDLQSAQTTPNYSFITPDLCSDGHDATCDQSGRAGGFAGIEQFLQTWVPKITSSPAYREQNGLLMITFDEAATSDASSCCGEVPGPGSPLPGETGAGGGRVGMVLLSPCIAPGTVSQTPYNHYAMLGSVENIFGLAHLGYAQLPGETYFGSDVFTRNCGSPPGVAFRSTAVHLARRGAATIAARWRSPVAGATYEVQERTSGGRWHTLLSGTTRTRAAFAARRGVTYLVRVRATNGVGITGIWQQRRVRVPRRGVRRSRTARRAARSSLNLAASPRRSRTA